MNILEGISHCCVYTCLWGVHVKERIFCREYQASPKVVPRFTHNATARVSLGNTFLIHNTRVMTESIFIVVLKQSLFTKSLLCAWHCPRHWRCCHEEKR